MESLKKVLNVFFRKYWPFLIILGIVLIFFWKTILLQLHPIPADFIVGTYFPWMDYEWGFPAGVPVKNPITSDVVSVIFPIRMLGVEMMKNGSLPLWNQYMFAGYPLLANMQAALLSPTILTYLILPAIWAWTSQVIIQSALAAILAYFLLRHFKLSKLASVFGGIIYAFSGFNLIWLEWNAHTLTAAFIPLLILLSDKLITTAKVKYGVFLSFAVALQIFSGYPQLVFYTFLAIAFLVFIRRKNIEKKVAIMLPIFIILGLLLSSVQTLPAYELLNLSQRSVETLGKEMFLPWRNLISIVAPDFFGNHSTGNFWGLGNYTYNTIYSGLVAFTLSIMAIFSRKRNEEINMFLMIALAALALSLPFPWNSWLVKLGVLGIRAASLTRIAVLFNLSIAVLSSFAIEELLKQKAKIKLPVYLPALAILLVFAFTKLVIVRGLQNDILVKQLEIGLRNLILPLAIALFTSFLLLFYQKFVNVKIIKNGVVYLIIIIAIIELFRFGWKFTPFSPEEFIFPRTPVIEFLDSTSKPNRVVTEGVIPMNMWMPFKIESLAGYDAVYPFSIAKYIAVSNSNKDWVSSQGRFGSISNLDSNLIHLTNNKYFMVLKENVEVESFDKDNVVFEDKSVMIIENKKVLPRAFFVSDWEVKPRDEILGDLIRKDFTYSSKILIEETTSSEPSKIHAEVKVKYIQKAGGMYDINIDTTADGMLFVSETFYPGWKAFIEDRQVKIYRANYAFSAVEVPKGEYMIHFVYKPQSFYGGLKITTATLFILLTILVVDIKSLARKGK